MLKYQPSWTSRNILGHNVTLRASPHKPGPIMPPTGLCAAFSEFRNGKVILPDTPSAVHLFHVKNIHQYQKGAIMNSLLKFAKETWVQLSLKIKSFSGFQGVTNKMWLKEEWEAWRLTDEHLFSVKLMTAMLTACTCLPALPPPGCKEGARARPGTCHWAPSDCGAAATVGGRRNPGPATRDELRHHLPPVTSVSHGGLLSRGAPCSGMCSLLGPCVHFESCSCCQHHAWPSHWEPRWKEEQLAWGNWESEHDYHPKFAVGPCFKNNYFKLHQWNRIGLTQNREVIFMLLLSFLCIERGDKQKRPKPIKFLR